MHIHRSAYPFMIALLFFVNTLRVSALSPSSTEGSETIDREHLAAFVDDFMATHMAQYHVPGAALVVVEGETLLLAKGFGTADRERQIPVDIDKTLFRAGSVSKLFTATAVMQLVEAGRIDLDADVNDYLASLKLAGQYDRSVTVADLLLHTAGFDDLFLGMHVRDAADLRSLSGFLQDHLPPRYVPPGEFISYNDHGYTLAGLLVEEVSGQRFDAYVAEHILQPLGMASSTFTQPPPETRQARMAVGYRYEDGVYIPYEHDYIQVSPAAALIGPAAEIGHFVSAHLNGGRFEGETILQPETVSAMQQTQFAHHPALRGRGYGFSEWLENGRRAVFHDGGNPGFLNRLFLLPDAGVGFYLTFNSDQYTGAGGFHRAFTSQFLDEFFPEDVVSEWNVAAVPMSRPAADFTGYYREMQAYSHDTLQKLDSLTKQVSVAAAGDGLAAFGRGYVAVEALRFQSPTEESTIVFRESESGDIDYLFIGTGAFVKVPWYEAQPAQLALLLLFLVIFVAAILGGFFWRGGQRSLRAVLAIVGLLNIGFLLGMAAVLLQMDPWQFAYGPPATVQLLLVLPLVTLALGLIMAWFTAAGWRSGQWGWPASVYATVVSAGVLAFPLFLDIWNLFGFHY